MTAHPAPPNPLTLLARRALILGPIILALVAIATTRPTTAQPDEYLGPPEPVGEEPIIEPIVFRAWVGNAADPDGVVRNLIVLQRRNTGADLYSAALDARVKHLLDVGETTTAIARAVLEGIRPQILESGAVVAPLDPGAKREPWHDHGWVQGGHAAAAAIIAAHAGDSATARRIAAWLADQQTRGDVYQVGGLWCAGDRFALVDDGAGRLVTPWRGWWRYADDYQYPAEDATQIACACVMRAFGYDDRFDAALDALGRVADLNGGALPYCIDRRTGRPTWGRNVSPAAISIEETAHAAALLQAVADDEHPSRLGASTAMVEFLRGAELPGRYSGVGGVWPRFVDESGRIVFPLASTAVGGAAIGGVGLGEITREARAAVDGFGGTTNRPLIVEGVR